MGILSDNPRSATIVAAPTTALRIDKRVFLELLGAVPADGPRGDARVGEPLERTNAQLAAQSK